MRRQRGLVKLMGLAALVGLGLLTKPAGAAVTTERSASILIFPKVIACNGRDTIIQITNTSNLTRMAHCFYVNGSPTIPGQPPGPFVCKGGALNGIPCLPQDPKACGGNPSICQQVNPPLCQETDFDIILTKQQPTHWVVSTGRLAPANEKTCRQATCDPDTTGGPHADCCDAGFDPGRIPPVVPCFTGELKCIETDVSGFFPDPGNALKGEATLEEAATGDVSKYNAIGLRANDNLNQDPILHLGGSASTAEYDGCPATWILDHSAVGAPDVVAGGDSTVTTQLTAVPCSENFELQSTPPVTMQFLITNEFEEQFSASTTFTCWGSFNLEDINPIFETGRLGGTLLQTRVRSATNTPVGIAAVIEETHTADVGEGTATTRSAQNGHSTLVTPDQEPADVITLPAEQIAP